jgi:AcrR family transcriptional regulator
MSAGQNSTRTPTGRERILTAAYDLFSRSGINGVGVDAVIAEAGVAKATLYRNFDSKDELALAFLERREELWTYGWVKAEAERRADDPRGRLLAIFEAFDDWFQRDDFEGCSFINALLEVDEQEDPVRLASVRHLANIRAFVRELAEAEGVADPDDFARQWHILMKGSIVARGEGDRDAARRARALGELVLSAQRSGPFGLPS